MNNTATPTPGAMRAAEQITSRYAETVERRAERVQAAAHIIDRETGNRELLEAYDELREFVRRATLQIQQHRSQTDAQMDLLFQDAYRLYEKHDVENRRAEGRE